MLKQLEANRCMLKRIQLNKVHFNAIQKRI
jgi:hypothetical protein